MQESLPDPASFSCFWNMNSCAFSLDRRAVFFKVDVKIFSRRNKLPAILPLGIIFFFSFIIIIVVVVCLFAGGHCLYFVFTSVCSTS